MLRERIVWTRIGFAQPLGRGDVEISTRRKIALGMILAEFMVLAALMCAILFWGVRLPPLPSLVPWVPLLFALTMSAGIAYDAIRTGHRARAFAMAAAHIVLGITISLTVTGLLLALGTYMLAGGLLHATAGLITFVRLTRQPVADTGT